MFKKTKTAKTPLEYTIDNLHLDMHNLTASSPEYAACADQLVKLYAIKDPKSKTSVTPDVAVTAAVNLAGIAMILHHERASVVASKALGFVQKLR